MALEACTCDCYVSSVAAMKDKSKLYHAKKDKLAKPLKILAQRLNEKLALVKYDKRILKTIWGDM